MSKEGRKIRGGIRLDLPVYNIRIRIIYFKEKIKKYNGIITGCINISLIKNILSGATCHE